MFEQRFLDLARIDVAAAADHHILRPVAQGQVAARIEGAHVSRAQPAVLQRGRGGLGVVPVAGYHNVAAADDFTDLVDRGRRSVRGEHGNIDTGSRVTHGSENRVVRIEVVGSAESGDRHRCFTLAVKLDEDRAERCHRLLQAVDVHGATAVDDGLQVGRA